MTIKKKMKEEIKKEVLIEILQFLGYIIFGLLVLFVLSLLFYFAYLVGEKSGYEQGFSDFQNDLINKVNQYGEVQIWTNGVYNLTLYKEQCPQSCYWDLKSIFTPNTRILTDIQETGKMYGMSCYGMSCSLDNQVYKLKEN